jgi:hypothetical protein
LYRWKDESASLNGGIYFQGILDDHSKYSLQSHSTIANTHSTENHELERYEVLTENKIGIFSCDNGLGTSAPSKLGVKKGITLNFWFWQSATNGAADRASQTLSMTGPVHSSLNQFPEDDTGLTW